MLTFLLRRLGWMALTLWAVYTASFFLMRSVPGGPFDSEKQVPEQIKRNIERRYKFDQPLLIQYADHLAHTLRLDFGPSYRLEDYTVNELIRQGFPVSASLGILAMAFALTIGLSAGILAAVRRGTGWDVVLMAFATIGITVPNFVLASAAIVCFVFKLHWFPAAGWGSVWQIVLPALCLGASFAGYIARLARTGMLEVLNLDYIRTAHAKGLPEWQVVLRHALKPALLPVVSYLGPATAGVLTGSLVLERIFALPGMGSHFIEAATQRDYPLALGMVMTYTILLFVLNTLVDLSYAWIDPRVKLQ